jgi:endogenous inhibitor of DNA gyrase (YacG/DUF329 family)
MTFYCPSCGKASQEEDKKRPHCGSDVTVLRGAKKSGVNHEKYKRDSAAEEGTITGRTYSMDQNRIRDAIKSKRCMICHFIEKDESDLLISWAGAGENIHKGLRIGECFCNHHFWRLRKVVNDVTAATLNGFLLDQFVSELDNKEKHQTEVWFRDYRDRQSGLTGQTACPVCGKLFAREREYIESIIAFLEDKENMPAYEKSRGLCIPHFIKVFLSLQDNMQRERLREIQKSHITELMHELQEFIRKQLPPQKWERTEDEKVAHWRSLEKLVGRIGTKWQ